MDSRSVYAATDPANNQHGLRCTDSTLKRCRSPRRRDKLGQIVPRCRCCCRVGQVFAIPPISTSANFWWDCEDLFYPTKPMNRPFEIERGSVEKSGELE